MAICDMKGLAMTFGRGMAALGKKRLLMRSVAPPTRRLTALWLVLGMLWFMTRKVSMFCFLVGLSKVKMRAVSALVLGKLPPVFYLKTTNIVFSLIFGLGMAVPGKCNNLLILKVMETQRLEPTQRWPMIPIWG